MEQEWVRVVIELAGMVGIGFGFVYTIKGDTRVLTERADIMDKRLDKIDTLLEKLSDAKGRMDVIDERLMQQGKRVDETQRLLVDYVRRITNLEHNGNGH